MAAPERVRAYEGQIVLPTYAIRGENPNPVFESRYGVAHIYPYTLLDDIAPEPQDRTYRSLQLENEYLRLTVLPELGGRVYSLFDKLSGREVFYKNHVVKFAPLAIRGAFFSGGLEFSFPVAHAPTTADAVNWDLRANADGSATITCGGLEHMGRLRWAIGLSLYPGRCALAQEVWLHNPTSVPGRYHYWTNASLPADDQTEFVYPLRRYRSYEFAGTASWPVGRLDLITADAGLEGMEGVPKWPAGRLHAPLDLRWQKHMIAQVSIFGRDVQWDFFGAWQHSADCGYAHFADHADVAGMKLWSWGNAGVGVMNQAALTDDGSLYAETQCGAMETQLDFDFLGPGATRRWREWWLPLRGLGGLTCASADVAARLRLSQGARPGSADLTVGLCPAQAVDEAIVTLAVPAGVLDRQAAALDPARPWLRTIEVEARDLGAQPLTLTVADAHGRVLLAYTHDRQPSHVDPVAAAPDGKAATAEDRYQLGLKHENFDRREEALHAYAQALKLQPDHGPAHLRRGLMLLRAADFTGAEAHLRAAEAAGLPDASFHLGALLLNVDRPEDASSCFERVPETHALASVARCGLGRIALGRADWGGALALFDQALAMPGGRPMADLLRAVALSRAGDATAACACLEDLLRRDPLNHAAWRELSLAQGPGSPGAVTLQRLLADDRQYWLDLACFYLDARLPEEALAVFAEAAAGWPYPMLGYMAWDLCRRLGRPNAESAAWLARARAAGPAGVYPSRLEEVVALRRVLEAQPDDDRAKYYLACFLYAHERRDEAVALWEAVAPRLEQFEFTYRSLALHDWQQRGDLVRAAERLEKALALNPDNQDLYLLLDRLYQARGQDDERRGLLTRMQAIAAPRDDLHKRMVVALVDLGQHEQAVRRLEDDHFVPSEMDQSFRGAYVRAYLGQAEARLEAGQVGAAIADYRRALDYPANVGTGRPLSPADAEILYRLGCACEQLGQYDEALAAWSRAAAEHHPHGSDLFAFVQSALDKLSRYAELGCYPAELKEDSQ